MSAGTVPPDAARAAPWPGWGRWLLRLALPFALLNALLTLENLWPTWWAVPALRLSFELSMATLALAAWVRLRGGAGPGVMRLFALLTTLWVVTRYAEVTASAVFGRQINWYWDGRHLFEVLAMGKVSHGQVAFGAVAVAATVVALYRLAHGCWSVMARQLAWPRPRPLLGLVGLALLAAFMLQGIGGRNTRWFFSMPVAPIVVRQAELLAGQLAPGRSDRQLSPSPAFDGTLAGLAGADVLLLFAESYGVSTLDDPAQAAALEPHRARFEQALQAGGRHAVSARVRSPTFGGASWLAHAALLSGVDTHDPGDYELLLTTRRPTLVSHFAARGWRTVGWMPGLQKPWPEGRFYGFDRVADASTIGYAGPAFGHWRIPDQAAMALLQAQELAEPPRRRAPRMMVFPTLASHAPFRPLAPYVSDWDRLLTAQAYTPQQLAEALDAPVSWLEPVPAYLEALAGSFEWLGDWLAHRAPPRILTIMIGDHQPMASVSGPGATWEVPVHIISDDAALLRRLEAAGFTPGLAPMEPATLPMHALTPLLLAAFDAAPDIGARALPDARSRP